MASRIAAKSWAYPSPNGTSNDSVIAHLDTTRYMTKEGQANTQVVPGPPTVRAMSLNNETLPAPTKMWSTGTPSQADRAADRSTVSLSGYRFELPTTAAIASSTPGNGPQGLSFEASLTSSPGSMPI